MKRDIEWTERLDDSVKRTVRVRIFAGKIKWQFKRSDEERWDYDTPASADDWETLDNKVNALYRRRRAAVNDVDLVRIEKKKHV
ncbi:MAG: hypothetical protein WC959_12150 [Kiritimatiellales bacterium]